MTITEEIKGTLRVFWEMTKDDFGELDHKAIRILGFAAGVVVTFLVYYFLLMG